MRELLMLHSCDQTMEQFDKNVNRLLACPELKGRVHLVGMVDNVSDYMQASDIFIFPSREEGMGNVVMEAMATMIPVVVTPYLGFPSVFGNNNQHYLRAEFDERSIANQVEQLLADSDLTRRLVQNAKTNIDEKLLLQDSIQQFANLYIQLKETL